MAEIDGCASDSGHTAPRSASVSVPANEVWGDSPSVRTTDGFCWSPFARPEPGIDQLQGEGRRADRGERGSCPSAILAPPWAEEVMKMKIVFAAVAIVASLVWAKAALAAMPSHLSSAINGKVVDSVDQHPLGGVEVDVFDDSSSSHTARAIATTMTREDGSFSLLGLRRGTYHLELAKRGYALEIVTGLSLGADERILIAQPFGMRSAVVTTGIGQGMETRI